MKVIGYARVSTSEQANHGVGLDVQMDKIRSYASTFELELIDICVDRGYSGKDTRRPALEESMKRVLSGEAQALIVYRLDRLNRNTRDFLNIVARLEDAGRAFISIREQMNSSTPHGRFAMTMLAAVGQLEREMISDRCRDAALRCMADRRVYGKTPYGYRRDGKRLIEDAEEMEHLLSMIALRAAGMSYDQIAKRLNVQCIKAKSGGVWYASSVRSVLTTYKKLNS